MSFKRRFILRILESIVFVFVVCGVIWFVLNKFNISRRPEVLTALNISDMYYTQISVSFIIISLVSVLTNASKPVYWVDITQYKLIEPEHSAFIDFAAYILGALIASSLLLLVNSNYMIVSFGFSILFMMLLTIKMISAYFGRDSVKNELQKEFQSLKNDMKKRNTDYSAELRKSIVINNTNNKRKTKGGKKTQQTYDEICNELEDKTYQEIDNKEYKAVRENLDLLVSNNEYDIVIDLLRYISENMVNIYCKYAKSYVKNVIAYKPDNYSQDHQNRFFQLTGTNLMRSVENNDLQEVSICLYGILLEGRFSQFTKEELENKRYYTRGQYWKRIEKILSTVYKMCINEDKYDLLDDFLYSFYKEQLAFRRRLCGMKDRNTEIVSGLYALYVGNLGLETILQGLAKKVGEGQIDYRQINMLIGSLNRIYSEIESNREKNKDVLDPEQLSKRIYDDNFVHLIELTYKNKLLDEQIRSQYAIQKSRELRDIYDRVILNSI